ncbi:MAG: ABC transporter ATP-binding protein [Pseudomonadota bacterium]|nr:ABC transporter ATP-binding protein [Pseudomonadota bacterium]
MAITPPDCAIRTHNLRKVYSLNGRHPVEALKGVDLDIPRGSIFGLLGPNGAGKSTFINIIANLVRKTSGIAEVWGHDIDRQRRQASACVGVVPQELTIDPFFTPRETLDLQAGYYGVPKTKRQTSAILAALGLADKAETYTRRLSGGMRRRLMVAKALVHQPPVIILDEPTAGVDVELRSQLWDYVRTLNQNGTTVVLTTHYLEEAEQMCDRIAIINQGNVVACDETQILMRELDQKAIRISTIEPVAKLGPALRKFGAHLKSPRVIEIRYQPSRLAIAQILNEIDKEGISVADLSISEPALEDLFREVTGKNEN